jgi:hypothetical protein
MGSSNISFQKILAASHGNPDLLEVLNQVNFTAVEQKAVTGTTPTAAPVAGQANPAAPVPAQATGSVSLLGTNYIVQIVNPGATSAISQLQAQQTAANATALTPLQPVKAIFHQIRVSTSPAFNVNSNTQTFGGNTGSTQVYWTLTGLGSGTWYFQFRSSFDGINFNTWKNANSGTAVGGLINQVTEENVGDANWALFTLPGGMVAGIGEGLCFDGEIFNLATQLYSSGLFAIAGPNGAPTLSTATCGVTECSVDLQTPNTGNAGVVGIPDFPVVIAMEYGITAALPAFMAGSATVFGIAVTPENENATFYAQNGGTPTTDSTWAVVQLPGGAKIAIGQGLNNHGDTIWTPPSLSWMSGTRAISVASLTGATDVGFVPDGYYANSINSSFVLSAQYHDTNGDIWNTQANWLVIAWQAGAATLSAGGNTFLVINLQGGHSVIIGSGTCASGTAVVLPSGYASAQKTLGIVVPNGDIVNPSNHNLSGIIQCSFAGLIPILSYADTTGHTWSGNVSWMMAAWK